MPVLPDEDKRIDILRAALLDIGLDWNKQYRLIDEGMKWSLEYIRTVTDEQYQQGKDFVETIMNS